MTLGANQVFPKNCRTSVPNLLGGGCVLKDPADTDTDVVVSDLDGDLYFIYWDRSFTPDRRLIRDPEPGSDALSSISVPTAERNLSDLPKDLVELFNHLFQSQLLGTVSKEWQNVVECDPKLADSRYPKELARIVAIALVRRHGCLPSCNCQLIVTM